MTGISREERSALWRRSCTQMFGTFPPPSRYAEDHLTVRSSLLDVSDGRTLLGGCVDSTNQSLALLYMTLGQQDVSKALLGPLSPYTVDFLRHIRDFFQIMFKIDPQKPGEDERRGGEKILMTCVGAGYSNISKTIK